jgi:hypothetical protein
VRAAKVVTDAATQRSKGFGFVRFGSASERDDALVTMNGVPCGAGGRPMRISLAAPKKPPGANGMLPQNGMLPPPHHGHPGGGGNGGRGSGGGAVFYNPHPAPGSGVGPDGGADPHNTTVFVGGLDAAVSEEELRAVFEQFGELVYVKIPHGKNCGAPRTAAQQLPAACCAAASLRVARALIAAPALSRLFSCSVCAAGFVQFLYRGNAEAAIAGANGATVGRQQARGWRARRMCVVTIRATHAKGLCRRSRPHLHSIGSRAVLHALKHARPRAPPSPRAHRCASPGAAPTAGAARSPPPPPPQRPLATATALLRTATASFRVTTGSSTCSTAAPTTPTLATVRAPAACAPGLRKARAHARCRKPY